MHAELSFLYTTIMHCFLQAAKIPLPWLQLLDIRRNVFLTVVLPLQRSSLRINAKEHHWLILQFAKFIF